MVVQLRYVHYQQCAANESNVVESPGTLVQNYQTTYDRSSEYEADTAVGVREPDLDFELRCSFLESWNEFEAFVEEGPVVLWLREDDHHQDNQGNNKVYLFGHTDFV